MSDLYFSIVLCGIVGLIGLPIARLLPIELFPQRILAAPVFGFICVGVFTAIIYRHEGSLWAVISLAAVAAVVTGIIELVSRLGSSSSFTVRPVLLTIATFAVVLLLCVAPKWAGGYRFAAFQGNPYDQLNYMTQAATYRAKTYGELSSPDDGQPLLTLGSGLRNSRPAPQIFLTALSELLGLDTVSATYPYVATLQALTFFALAFLIAQVFTPRIELTLLCAAAGTLGFPMQYIVDINAWGKLAGMPVAVAGLGALITILSAAKIITGQLLVRLAAVFSLIVAGLLYYYPEMIPVYGAAALAAIAVGVILGPRERVLWNLLPAVAGLLFGMLSSFLFWEGSFGFFIYEISFAAQQNVDWWRYFQEYLIAPPITDFLTAAIGLYFIVPRDLPTFVSIPWRFAAYSFTAAVLIGAAWTWYRVGWPKPRPMMLLAGTLFMLVEISVTALTGRYWPAGEALAMMAPVLFVVLAAPLLLAPVPWAMRFVSLSFAALYLAFGLARPIFAANASGVHYSRPYPAAMDPLLKTKYDWNVERLATALKDCTALVIDVDSRLFERYMAVYLTDHHLTWSSTHPALASLEEPTSTRSALPISADADCIITDTFEASTPTRRLISVAADQRLSAFLEGSLHALEIAPNTPPGVKVVGAYDVELYRHDPLRWTSAEAHFLLPNNPLAPVTGIAVAAWPIVPGRNMTVRINGTTVYEGLTPSDSTPWKWKIPDRSTDMIDIEIRAEPFRGKDDPRDLGIALRSLMATK